MFRSAASLNRNSISFHPIQTPGGLINRSFRFFLFLAVISLPIGSATAQIRIRAAIDGTQAGTGSPAVGTIYGTFSPDMKSLTCQITYAKLTGSFPASHFHFTPTGGILQPITFVGNTATGTWAFPGGDIRGTFTFHNGTFVTTPTGASAGTACERHLFFRLPAGNAIQVKKIMLL